VSKQCNEYELNCRGQQTLLTSLHEEKLDAIGFTEIVGVTEEEAPVECVSSASVQPEEARSGAEVKSENNGILSLVAFQVGRNGGVALIC
jgi:hypothetical protein